ncbi:hypothetical protein SCATT_37700 [Streptantibioticus cattleyicolor NRRL 8057 = DSM 46488]|uniref:Uncharacterized protein n=1 Tax=Streptantibioticus cattleyicolor (strain ATCC 35852 / DSM 46488 / JCM 4925 / NBRC 14057 / NRRL 8057) TaxID=1003195 RepID=G8X308_STREN|nr:hypothetical protein SCATT_37700 [Streptantibioticus cattleyicolor NRRL 8057 = DSM 46488]
MDREVDVVIGDNSGEPLGDPGELYGGRRACGADGALSSGRRSRAVKEPGVGGRYRVVRKFGPLRA